MIELRGTTEQIITIAGMDAFPLGVTFSTGGSQTREALTETARWVTERGVRILHRRRSYPLAEAAAAHTGSEYGKLTLTLPQHGARCGHGAVVRVGR
ncbi:hypothetical protein J2S43_004388 [Catenuloplanes nepalensis]|uniref:Uncharacterized protein n=1 Tax=Catenuloplanes nepalensis TaxID=587533 RepID=A0ABT9MXW7_9ACTN|nr:hypothetical protein [Catenuloplanes nepalensis]MDP9795876.1 hypothetical protein [Catenuloplanes nepalensis]